MAAAASTLFSLSFPTEPQIPTLSPPSRFLPLPKPTLKRSSSVHSHSHSSLTLGADDPIHTGRFLSDDERRRLHALESFLYCRDLSSGSLSVRVMRPHQIHLAVRLLADSFADSLLLPAAYATFLGYLISRYLTHRATLMPHAATLLAFFTAHDQILFAGTVELSFDKAGANASVPAPAPPADAPYISNMAVDKSLRRRGIGWHLLKASEELISQMSASREVYLHCRIIDEAPFNMYTKADYKVVKTDSILALLMLQRRKHLMCKKLPPLITPSETDPDPSVSDA
ncbi:uncharacterized protein LOC109801564 [Cajanus cajan]|uniref:N-acetyltransferase domain-containing protein n=1 Tax=Cajanus cajan TaxID=3821 RepID=A0A151TGM0_CAJCA|nr:uncharacterized protein LOC109801564 [Cajanus cajan]KYP66197.1 hypothetical protein KK1_012483 [Cajanus cajan]